MEWTCKPARDADHWSHHVIAIRPISHSKLNISYVRHIFKVLPNRKWDAEISGRLLSLAFDLEPFAKKKSIAIGKRLHGYAHALVTDIRNHPYLDAIWAAICEDFAHANVIAENIEFAPIDPMSPARRRVSDKVCKKIMELLVVAQTETEIGELEMHRIALDRTTKGGRAIRTLVAKVRVRQNG
jgi:hypothetical protein